MRVLIVLLALAVTPFLTAVSQTPSGSPEPEQCAEPAHEHSGDVVGHNQNVANDPDEDKDKDDDCVPPTPPPPPPASVAIDGTVFEDIVGRPPLTNWAIDLSGPVTATTLTDAAGHYAFTGLAGGTYTVCEEVQIGWRQTFPPLGAACLTGVGYTFTLTAGTSASFVNFGNARQ